MLRLLLRLQAQTIMLHLINFLLKVILGVRWIFDALTHVYKSKKN